MDASIHCSSGIAGLNAAFHGGFRRRHTMLVTGGPGSGKTMLGMQYLAAQDEPGLFLSFEETPLRLVENAQSLTIPFAQKANRSIHFLDGRPPADTMAIGNFDLHGLLATLDAIVAERHIKHIVIDAIDVLFAAGGDLRGVRAETCRLLDWLNTAGLTAVMTMKTTAPGDSFMDDFGFVEFAVDSVVHFHSVVYGSVVQRTLRIIKRGGAPFVSGEHPYTIGIHGIRVMCSGIRTSIAESDGKVRCSSGVERLDRMLMGGFLRGTTTLFSGLPGSAKTTFGAAFLAAGCAEGERGLFIGFDEPAEQMARNVRSVGIDLKPFVATNLLRLESFTGCAAIADDFYMVIEDAIDEFQPQRIVIDPISALTKAGGVEIAENVIERLVVLFKERGLSAVFTSVPGATTNVQESAATRISAIADNWIHLSFAAQGGERNRTLTVVKARGTGHSSQTREVLLDEHGITLADVYTFDGAVLFGTARLQREQSEHAARLEERRVVAHELRTIEQERVTLEMRAQQVVLQIAQLKERQAELEEHAETMVTAMDAATAAVQQQRRADPDDSAARGADS